MGAPGITAAATPFPEGKPVSPEIYLLYFWIWDHTRQFSGLTPDSTLRGPYGVLEIELGLAACKANALPDPAPEINLP